MFIIIIITVIVKTKHYFDNDLIIEIKGNKKTSYINKKCLLSFPSLSTTTKNYEEIEQFQYIASFFANNDNFRYL